MKHSSNSSESSFLVSSSVLAHIAIILSKHIVNTDFEKLAEHTCIHLPVPRAPWWHRLYRAVFHQLWPRLWSLISGNPFSLLALICAVLLSLQSEGFIQPRKEHVTEEDHELEAENSVPKKGNSLIKYAWWRQEVLTGEIILISTPKLTASPWIFFPFFFLYFFIFLFFF